MLKESVRHAALDDFEDFYMRLRSRRGRSIALLWYWLQIFLMIPSFIKDSTYWSINMFSNYLKIALRNIKRSRVYSLINISGLAVGMTCCILILLWVQDELSYDRFFEHKDQLHRVVQEQQFSNRTEYSSTTPTALSPALKKDFSDIAQTSRFFNTGWSIQYEGQIFSEEGSFADADFLRMFSLDFLKGDPSTALNDPVSIVITDELALKLFGHSDPMGRTLKIDNAVDCEVTGVVKKLPRNSHISFDYIVPFSIFRHRGLEIETWEQSYFISTYVLILPESRPEEVDDKIAGAIFKHVPGSNSRLFLQPLIRIHLHHLQGGGAILYVYIFTSIAAFILLIACINFMNLSTARSRSRAKEVGVRKVVGGSRRDIIKQFFGEAQMLTILALLIAVLLVLVLLPLFNQLSGKELTVGTLLHPNILVAIMVVAILTGMLSGSYPALYLSAFRPSQVLKGMLKTKSKSSFRRVLVILQFSLSVLLIISTLVVSQQLRYIRNTPLGFAKEHILSARMAKGSADFGTVKRELLRNPQILNITATDRPPSYSGTSVSNVVWEGKSPEDHVKMELRYVDYDFFKTFDMEIIEGRSFSKEFPTDQNEGLVINETAARIMETGGDFGQQVKVNDSLHPIIGVVKDYHLQSFYKEINPLLIVLKPKECLYVCIRISPEYVPDSIKVIGSHWKILDPGYEFEYEFLDERIDRRYRSEQRMNKLLSLFTGLAILISCLGLLGLASYLGEQRTKEIGIRKVLGASTSGIVILLSREFVRWVLLANLLAWPIAYYLMQNWLMKFAYRTPLVWWIFVLAAALSLGIAILTIAYQAIKTAATDPIESLRYE
jgi:putative ABC transport system permease protein